MNPARKYYFLTIAETRNITRAAEQLYVSQPSLSQYLTKLEQDLDIKLVDRGFTPLCITPAGQKYYEYLKASAALDAALESDLAELRAQEKVPLRIGMPMQKTHEVINLVFPAFQNKYPNVDLSVWEGTTSTVKEEVLKGNVDIGFGHAFTTEDPDCVVKRLNYEKITIICNANNPILRGRKTSPDDPADIAPEDLYDQLFYQMASQYYLCTVETEHLARYHVKPRKRLIMSNLRNIMSSVAKNKDSGFAYVPDYCLTETFGGDRFLDQLGFLRLGGKDIEWQFVMLRRKNKTPSREARLFWNTVVETCCENK